MKTRKRLRSIDFVPVDTLSNDAAEALGALDRGLRTIAANPVKDNGHTRYAPKVGPATGEKPLFAELGDNRPKSAGFKLEDDFLFPPMLGAFVPSTVRKLPLDDLRARYLKVLNATMGNHSMSLFYCDWTQEQFEAALNARFKKQIKSARSQLADRVTYMMHRAMGLIKSERSEVANTQVIAAMARVAEKLNERNEMQESTKGYKLIIEGLEQTAEGKPPSKDAK